MCNIILVPHVQYYTCTICAIKKDLGREGGTKDSIEGKNTEEKGRMNEGFQRYGIKCTPRSL